MVQYEPTHSVTHKDGWQANIYIADSLYTQLYSRNLFERDKARDAICIRFRAACRAKYPQFGLMRVEWSDLRPLQPLQPMSDPTVYPRETSPRAMPPVSTGPVDTRECDDCSQKCDIGYHERCEQPGGCPIADGWTR